MNEPTRGQGPLFNQQDKPTTQPPPPSLSIWDDAVLIDMYTRAEALEDGVLVDCGKLAKEAGFVFPVACTRAVWDGYIDPGTIGLGQSVDGRLWDTLQLLRRAIKAAPAGVDVIWFKCIYVMAAGQSRLVALKAVCSGGDQGEPVITVALPEED